ncbi:aminopeptidase P family protein [Microbacterium sp. MPKO10]|uniref:aminopeptidase P family protein n=1 Tax=Microbacterium sp. MPKO10 TaxID=2989818 RepID=UPI0022368F23|nr:aminopeptidase P family protein [Microbacterium sp. MPKO10]MCW4459987.1 aminopeptidase P family protein [Microbacterium sp. MPKO10]
MTARSMPTGKDARMPRLAQIDAFTRYMGEGWASPDRTPQVEPGIAAASGEHRERLSAQFSGQNVVVFSGTAPIRVNDCAFDFRPDSGFFWLTGCTAEDAVVVLFARAGGHDAVLYVPEPAYPGDTDFFGNALHGELWVGPAPSPAEWATVLQVEVRGRRQLDGDLQRLSDLHIAGRLDTATLPGRLAGQTASASLERQLSELRMIKDAWEITQLRRAVDDTMNGFAAVAREIPRAVAGGGERWLQGTFERHSRTHGNGPGYSTIVGSGDHAPILHWVRCDGDVNPDDALLLDMGVEARTLYTADVTRTLPVSGTFSPAQRQVHDLVEKAHRAGLAAVRPGAQFSDFHTVMMEVIAQGLHDWDLLPVSVDEALSERGQHHRRYIVCGVGHHLGLDVHDCARADYSAYQGAPLADGMVLTVEPGLYFHAFDETVPPELRGIGVRLEDDILVTERASEVLSESLPISADGIESWTAEHLAAADS